MTKRRKTMRLEETGLRITENAVLAHNAAGEILSEYNRRHTRPPLDIWFGKGTPAEGKRSLKRMAYEAGLRYAEMWRAAYQPRSPAGMKWEIGVDGAAAAPMPRTGNDSAMRELQELWQTVIRDGEQIHHLNKLCGEEWWPEGDKRRFKRICRNALERLAMFWRKR